MAGAAVRVTGLIECRNAIRKLEPDVKKILPRELKKVAEQVAADARAKVPSVSGKAASSIKARSSASTASVVAGRKTVPYYGWLDFGGRTPRKGNPRSVGPWKGSGKGPKDGRFIYPAIKKNRKNIEKAAYEAIGKAKRAAGLPQ